MRSLAEATARMTNEVLGRKYVALGRITSHWSDIVGADLANKVTPVKIHYRKYKNRVKTPEATLEIATSSAYATRMHYQKDLILERINQIFGERWITALRFVTVAANTEKRPIKPKTHHLDAAKQKDLSVMLDLIEDPDIKERLKNLGTAVLSTTDKK